MGDLSHNWSGERKSMPNGDASANARMTRWSAALLSRFSVIWPKAWADVTALTPHELLVAEWAKGLEKLIPAPMPGEDPALTRLAREEQAGALMRRGLEHCRDHLTWPPSIAEFLAACRNGANAEQRAFAARAEREAAERRPALTHGTFGDVAGVVREHVQHAQRQIAQRAHRSLVNIASGAWTREMEANYRQHAQLLGYPVKPTEWPDGEIA